MDDSYFDPPHIPAWEEDLQNCEECDGTGCIRCDGTGKYYWSKEDQQLADWEDDFTGGRRR
jgi:hypothetical protein